MTTSDPDQAWRPLVAALANDDVLAAYARMVLGDDVSPALEALRPAKRSRVLDALTQAGLVSSAGNGTEPERVTDAFTRLLATARVRPRIGIERFIRDGRLERYPVVAEERRTVLSWIAQHVLQPGEVVTEAQINERLTVFTRDFVTLRRYLVDLELVERSRDGAAYALVVE